MHPSSRFKLFCNARIASLAAVLGLCACSAWAPDEARDGIRLSNHFGGIERMLATAAGRGNTNTVAFLVWFANPNAVSTEGMPLLLWPVHTGNLDGFEALLQHGADPNGRVLLSGARSDILMDLIVGRADVRFVRAALGHGARPGAVNIDGEPLVYVAARGGHWDSVRALIGAGADMNANNGIEWQTVLSVASGFGNFEQTYWLLEHGANPTYALKQAPTQERLGAQPILEDIFWMPPGDRQPADSLEWQARSQQWLRDHDIKPPPEPERWRKIRAQRQHL